VHVFRINGAAWIEEFVYETPTPGDRLGQSIAMSANGDLIAAGAPLRLFPPSMSYPHGAVDVFRRDASGWVLENSITRLYLSSGLGAAVAMSGDGNVIAARDNAGAINGAVFLYQRNGGAWDQVGQVQEPALSSQAAFGFSVALDSKGDRLVVGSPHDYRMGYLTGAVFIFGRDSSGWMLERDFVLPHPDTDARLGFSVAVNGAGDRVLAGAPNYQAPASYSGAVFEYARTNGAWLQVAQHGSSAPAEENGFGLQVRCGATGRTWAASETGSDVLAADGGIVHVFRNDCTEPATYCSAQTNSLGCVALIGSQGNPSASAGSGFDITLSNTRNQRTGILFYGTEGGASNPWNGGTLCVRPPLRRTPLQSSGGNVPPLDDCSGSLRFDFNASVAAAPDPALFAGQHVHAQYLCRDPSPTTSVNTSDALSFYLEP
jgi:hypothetical protein